MTVDDKTRAALDRENEALRRRIVELEQELTTLRARHARAISAEQALIESEARYRILVETSPGAILLTDLDGVIRFGNRQAAHLFGYSAPDDLCGQNSTDLIVFDQLMPSPLAYAQRIAASGDLRSIECVLRRSDGSRFPAEVSSAVVTNVQGVPTALTIIVRDISERKQAEHALTDAYHHLEELNQHVIRSRNLLQAVFDGLDDGLVLLDASGGVQIINRALAALLGSTPENLVGQNWATLYPRLAPDFPSHLALDLSPNGRSRYQHTRYLNLDGATRVLEVQTIALQGDSQVTKQFIVHVIDVTDTIQLQARMVENERFIASGRLAASVAHEINTPLQSLQTALGLAQKMTSETDRAMFLCHAQEEIQRVARIVRQLLDLYRPGAATPGPVDINALIERLLLMVGKQLRDQRITVERDLAHDLLPVQGRADELMQVFLNLLMNAIDAMPDGGVLRVQTSVTRDGWPAPGAVVVSIADSGCGINPTLYKRIFEPFVTTKEGGTGLGLAISSQLVQKHGGKITLDSRLDAGSTFTVILPFRPISSEEEL